MEKPDTFVVHQSQWRSKSKDYDLEAKNWQTVCRKNHLGTDNYFEKYQFF